MAPGKLLLTGAYAVLDGAPAVVVAVDRYAVADASRPSDHPSPEMAAIGEDEVVPQVDVRALHDETGRKLGLGSSAAALVASLGARALARGKDLGDPSVREEIWRAARAAHARAQNGGSGVDVAASVYGGVLRYTTDATGGAAFRAAALPAGLRIEAFDSGGSARTSEMLARVARLRAASPTHRIFAELRSVASAAAAALDEGDARQFVVAARAFGAALSTLGAAADALVVPPRFEELATLAGRDESAFLPSGAGGGDVAIWLGLSPPPEAFLARAEDLSMRALSLRIDRGGLRPVPTL